MFSGYPVNIQPDINDVTNALNQISQIRQQDVIALNGLGNNFLSGRRVAKVPANSADTNGNNIGDFNVTAAYAYFCVSNGTGGAEWVRIAAATF